MTTKEFCKARYVEQKATLGRKPTAVEYYSGSGIPEGRLVRLFGPSPFSKLQADCGDTPNKLKMTRTSLNEIMSQYGDLALELQHLPTVPEWSHKGCRPARSGLRKEPHNLLWSQMPAKFKQWVESGKREQYESIRHLLPKLEAEPTKDARVPELEKLLTDIRRWSPARRRNTEESYKVELRKHLESCGHKLNEEFGESKTDLVVGRRFAIETKKGPLLADYDRLFGQIARHLQNHSEVIVVIFDVPREDQLETFNELVDLHLNHDNFIVKILKK